MKEPQHIHIAIFASGAGSNAEAIIKYFKDHATIKVALIVTNVKTAGVIHIAKEHRIPFDIVSKAELQEQDTMLDLLDLYQIDYIALAGWLLLIPSYLIAAYPRRIVNIHPALLPAHGGRGMYGMAVHQAVIASGDSSTGITIHTINERYDEGEYLFQASCAVTEMDDINTIAAKVRRLEHEHLAPQLEKLIAFNQRS